MQPVSPRSFLTPKPPVEEHCRSRALTVTAKTEDNSILAIASHQRLAQNIDGKRSDSVLEHVILESSAHRDVWQKISPNG